MRLLKVATCSLNQWAMDFDLNLRNIKESITRAKELGATIRVGPELEITGYGCEDHFFEPDTVAHAWECLTELLSGEWTEGILCSIGIPIREGSTLYNCQVFCLNRKILLIRPKMCLAGDGNYREPRWFSAWKHREQLIDFQLPNIVSETTSQKSVPFGYGYLMFSDTMVAAETCEELFTPDAPRIELALNGVEIFVNASGSHHQLRKLNIRMDRIKNATFICGGVYIYSNHKGCDGGRLYFDGCSCVAVNGDIVAQGSQFSLKDVEVLVAQVDLDAVVSYRGAISSLRDQASYKPKVPSVAVHYKLCHTFDFQEFPTLPIDVKYHVPEEEIALGPSCWLWDYLRRSGASGYLLPLSGGADSSSVAAIVGCMCQLVIEAIADGDEQVKADAIRIGKYHNGEVPHNSKEFAKRIFYTVYMGTENSSEATRLRAKAVSDEIGSHHIDMKIDVVISALISLFHTLTGRRPCYEYDCSSADLNPIGSVSKVDLRSFLRWASVNLGFTSLAEVEAAPPTAELEPIRANYSQLDEVDMGMTYEELSLYGRLRKIFRCGPVSMFQNLVHVWHGRLTSSEVAAKVKHFFKYYSMNRHKMTVLTPSYHAESYSPEDNRFDLRQFLYNTRWPYQFHKIDELVQKSEACGIPLVKPSEPTALETSKVHAGGMGVIAANAGNPSTGL
ncbi:glutamine-dependent NAD(+) synthetase isoform X2 [Nymphaea colorata]|uniref:glutamine-dependent NAD(+) synthetase isoform X2 n=1 Tax=Nymphaea colorata TaxID=210225 RepID=UPI00129DA172|nr:glutamine-dependent NAD(+) synthetase isoform X2 [Nymphaea colorata]